MTSYPEFSIGDVLPYVKGINAIIFIFPVTFIVLGFPIVMKFAGEGLF